MCNRESKPLAIKLGHCETVKTPFRRNMPSSLPFCLMTEIWSVHQVPLSWSGDILETWLLGPLSLQEESLALCAQAVVPCYSGFTGN